MNLSDLPKADQDAIEADKQAWFKAWTMSENGTIRAYVSGWRRRSRITGGIWRAD
jgi:hypothetical protein